MTRSDVKQREFMLSSGLRCIVLFGSTIEGDKLVKVEYYLQVRNINNYTIYHFGIFKTKSSNKWLKIVQVENYEVIR